MTMTYGFLTIAASALETRGEQGFTFNAGRGSLAQGLEYIILRTFNPALRKNIASNQTYMKWKERPRHETAGSWAFFEYTTHSAAAINNIPSLSKALRLRGGEGFFSGWYGGYTSCLILRQ